MDTACSSSLVAVHMAMQALRAGDSRMAVACGSNVILGPEMYIIESKVKMLSPNGLGRMWDSKADGYARGDGVAAVVLKTLSSALEDNDHIECIIRETGLNQDGTTTGLTMPSATSQQALIQTTYAKAGLDLNKQADRPQYFEAHGTGTPAGGMYQTPPPTFTSVVRQILILCSKILLKQKQLAGRFSVMSARVIIHFTLAP